ncbi:LAME_0F15412g1_1 [Lachancea meyersii CBS 8951]|uniref:LAME_0F15412g1_1 n=1 Tax=Lachancea meyersii CBS 8951 TaxID=1266667 RepID=A0A1G4JYN8_9SACH|nr:LAME_0F15412g1_1 [Lachancea meyersii CBS 8951]
MRRLQLFGRARDEPVPTTELQNVRARAYHNTRIQSDPDPKGLLSLSPGILDQVLRLLDVSTLLSLCLVNSKLYNIISNKFLYQNVVLQDKLALLQFVALIHCETHTSDALTEPRAGVSSQNLRFLVRSAEFVNPVYQDSVLKYGKYCSKDHSETIGSSYRLFNDPHKMQSFVREKSPEVAPSIERGRSPVNGKRLRNRSLTRSLSRHKSPPRRSFFDLSSNSRSKTMAKYENHTYLELMLDIIDFCPNLTHIVLSGIQQGFKIPLWYSVLNDGSKDFYKRIIKGQQSLNRDDLMSFEFSAEWLSNYEEKYHNLPRFKKLEFRAASDKAPVHLRSNMLSCFGIFDELILQNMVIDAESLDAPFEYVPLYMRVGEGGFLDLHLPISSLSLNGCEIIPGQGLMKLMRSYFHRVKTLKLLNLHSRYDLILANCFQSLGHLMIDCNSDCFHHHRVVNPVYYHKDISQSCSDNVSLAETLVDAPVIRKLTVPPATTPIVLAMNDGYIKRVNDSDGKKPGILSEAQEQYFKNMRIHPFHYFYHYYKTLWDRLPTKGIKISIVNIPFTNVFPLQPLHFWRQLDIYTEDDLQTLCGSNQADEGDPGSHWWDSAVCLCSKNTNASTVEGFSDYEVMDQQQFWNSYQNIHLFKDIPNVNLWMFFKSLSEFKSVDIRMLKKWQWCTPRTRYDWEILLRPLLNAEKMVTVRDNDGFVLYKYGS